MIEFPDIALAARAFLAGSHLAQTTSFSSLLLSAAKDTGVCTVLEIDPAPGSAQQESNAWDKLFLMRQTQAGYTLSTFVSGLTLSIEGMDHTSAQALVQQSNKEKGWTQAAQDEKQREFDISQEEVTKRIAIQTAQRDEDRR